MLLAPLVLFLTQSSFAQPENNDTISTEAISICEAKNDNEADIQLKILENDSNFQIQVKEDQYDAKESPAISIQPPNDKDINYFINYFVTTKKSLIENTLKKTNRFISTAKQIFRQEGLPEELVYLAVIESGFNPFVTSPSNAAGIWQFMPSTAKKLGLKVNKRVDERKDPYKSTIAAAKYLKSLYNMFGSWELAIASYNCGSGCIAKRLESLSATSFSEIKHALPSETKRYVPKFYAILLVMNDPEKYGLNVKSNKKESIPN